MLYTTGACNLRLYTPRRMYNVLRSSSFIHLQLMLRVFMFFLFVVQYFGIRPVFRYVLDDLIFGSEFSFKLGFKPNLGLSPMQKCGDNTDWF